MVAFKLFLMTVAVVSVVLVIAATALYRLNKLIDTNEPRKSVSSRQTNKGDEPCSNGCRRRVTRNGFGNPGVGRSR
jgi:hypothetical protein